MKWNHVFVVFCGKIGAEAKGNGVKPFSKEGPVSHARCCLCGETHAIRKEP